MKAIYDAQLLAEIKAASDPWLALFDEFCCLKNNEIPILLGGLDHVTVTDRSVTFHDVGMNGKANNFRIIG